MIGNILSGTRLYLLMLGLPILLTVFIKLGLRADVLPDLGLGLTYSSAVYYPIGVMQIFLYGLFVSEVYGSPLGLESLLFVITYYFCSKYRTLLLSKKPLSIFAGFVVIALVCGLAKYGLMIFYHDNFFDYKKVLMQIFTTIFFYPSLLLLFRNVIGASKM